MFYPVLLDSTTRNYALVENESICTSANCHLAAKVCASGPHCQKCFQHIHLIWLTSKQIFLVFFNGRAKVKQKWSKLNVPCAHKLCEVSRKDIFIFLQFHLMMTNTSQVLRIQANEFIIWLRKQQTISFLSSMHEFCQWQILIWTLPPFSCHCDCGVSEMCAANWNAWKASHFHDNGEHCATSGLLSQSMHDFVPRGGPWLHDIAILHWTPFAQVHCTTFFSKPFGNAKVTHTQVTDWPHRWSSPLSARSACVVDHDKQMLQHKNSLRVKNKPFCASPEQTCCGITVLHSGEKKDHFHWVFTNRHTTHRFAVIVNDWTCVWQNTKAKKIRFLQEHTTLGLPFDHANPNLHHSWSCLVEHTVQVSHARMWKCHSISLHDLSKNSQFGSSWWWHQEQTMTTKCRFFQPHGWHLEIQSRRCGKI